MRIVRTFMLVALVPMFLAGLLTACQPDAADEADVADATEEMAGDEMEATEAPTEEMADDTMDGEGGLKIGVLLPFTGDLSDFGAAMFNAAQMAADEINAAGGVNGQDIELVRGDTGTTPQQGVTEAQRLIDVEGVHAIVGAASSGVTLAVAESVTGDAGVVQISPASTSPGLTVADDNDYLFRTTISDAAQGVVLAEVAEQQGYESVCTMFVNNAYGQGLSEVFTENFEAAGGSVSANVPHEQEQASYVTELTTCTEGGPAALAAISYPESARVYLREAIEQQVIDQFLFVDGTKSDEMFEDLGWESFEGMYGTAPGALDREVGNSFDMRYEEAFGERPPLPFLRETYDAVYLIALSAQAAGEASTAAIHDQLRNVANPPGTAIPAGPDGWDDAIAALEAGEDIDYEGAASPANFDEAGDVLSGAIEIWNVQDGAINVVEVRPIDLSAEAEAP